MLAAPLLELAQDESVQSKVLDVARQFFSNSNITINLIPALIAGGLLLLLLPLLFLFLAPADDAGSGYGAPAAEYGAPSSSYGAPSSSYGYRAVSNTLTRDNVVDLIFHFQRVGIKAGFVCWTSVNPIIVLPRLGTRLLVRKPI